MNDLVTHFQYLAWGSHQNYLDSKKEEYCPGVVHKTYNLDLRRAFSLDHGMMSLQDPKRSVRFQRHWQHIPISIRILSCLILSFN
jgi:hypothetical protein